MTENQAKDLDRMLALIVSRDKMYPGNNTNNSRISDKLNIPRENVTELLDILVDIKDNHGYKVVEMLHENANGQKNFAKNSNTEPFIEVGGCIQLFNNEHESYKEHETRRNKEDQKLNNDLDLYSITKRHYTFIVLAAIIGWILFLVQLFL